MLAALSALCAAAALAPLPGRAPRAMASRGHSARAKTSGVHVRATRTALRSSTNPVPPEDKENRPPAIDPYQLPDATTEGGVATILEATFVQACMQLSTGYVDTLKYFIAAATSAYERGFTVPALQLELSQVTAQTAGRPLAPEEAELRTVWLSLVYLTLANVGHATSGNPEAVGASAPPEIRQKFQTFVYDVVNAKQGGFTLESLKLEDMLRRQGADAEALSPLEKAILGQSMRVVFLTLAVRDEAAEAANLPPPRRPGPSIPGI